MAQTKVVTPFVIRSKRTPKESRKLRSEVFGVLPEDESDKKSVSLSGFLFRRDGAGWECREVVYIPNLTTGKRERKRPYLSHLSRTNYEAMKKKSTSDDDLENRLIEWANAKKAGKANA